MCLFSATETLDVLVRIKRRFSYEAPDQELSLPKENGISLFSVAVDVAIVSWQEMFQTLGEIGKMFWCTCQPPSPVQ